jgi:hypothetical protein
LIEICAIFEAKQPLFWLKYSDDFIPLRQEEEEEKKKGRKKIFGFKGRGIWGTGKSVWDGGG